MQLAVLCKIQYGHVNSIYIYIINVGYICIFLLAVRTALVALIAFMPTSPNGALGSLDYKKEERRALAIKSREAAPRFGTPERQKLMDEVFLF